jgi:hypothetical protein
MRLLKFQERNTGIAPRVFWIKNSGRVPGGEREEMKPGHFETYSSWGSADRLVAVMQSIPLPVCVELVGYEIPPCRPAVI